MTHRSSGNWDLIVANSGSLKNPFCTRICRSDGQIEYEYDSTGIFHWCPARPMDEALLSRYIITWCPARPMDEVLLSRYIITWCPARPMDEVLLSRYIITWCPARLMDEVLLSRYMGALPDKWMRCFYPGT